MILIRLVLFLLMITIGYIVLISGTILYFTIDGKQSGKIEIFGINKKDWKYIYFIFGFILTALIFIHLYLNKGFILQYFRSLIRNNKS
ncbi:MAG: DUF4405 domain-containing protein [Nanoarchaeales archaeon]